MRFKVGRAHPFLLLLTVVFVSLLVVAACGDGDPEPTAAPADTGAAEAAAEAAQAAEAAEAAVSEAAMAAEAAVSEASEAAAAAAKAAEDAVALAAELTAAAQAAAEAAGEGESAAVTAALEAAAKAVAAAEAAADQAAELAMAAAEARAEAAAEAAAAPVEPKYGGSLRAGYALEHGTLDPPVLITHIGNTIIMQTHDRLVTFDRDLTLQPELATSWEANEDFTSYTIHLRRGVKFHHGKDLKAEDVIYTFQRLLSPEIDSVVRNALSIIEEMVAVDDYTVRFDLSSSNALFMNDLAAYYHASILPSEIDGEELPLLTDKFDIQTYGTGPFMLVEHLQGERTTLVRNPNYWRQGYPYLDEIVFLNIREQAARTQALKAGDIDVMTQLDLQIVSALEGEPDIKLQEVATSGWIAMPMRNDIPPFDNKLLRQAMQAAADRELIRQTALLGRGAIAYDHPIPPSHPLFSAEAAAKVRYDPDRARELLAEAGYPDGIDVTLFTGDVGPGMIDMAVAFRQGAAPAGIRVAIEERASDRYWADTWGVEPFTVVYAYGRPHPSQHLDLLYNSTSAWNAQKYQNQTVDDLVANAKSQDPESEKESYVEIQNILIDDVPQLLVAFLPQMSAARSNVYGSEPHPLGWDYLRDAWIDE